MKKKKKKKNGGHHHPHHHYNFPAATQLHQISLILRCRRRGHYLFPLISALCASVLLFLAAFALLSSPPRRLSSNAATSSSSLATIPPSPRHSSSSPSHFSSPSLSIRAPNRQLKRFTYLTLAQALTMEGGTMDNTLPRLDLMTSKLIKRAISWDKIGFVVANIAQLQAPFPSFSPLFPISLRKLKIEVASVCVEMVRSAAAMVSRGSPLFLPLLSNFINPISRIGLGVWRKKKIRKQR